MKAPASEPAFIRAQRAFARYLRDPEHAPAPAGLPAARVAVYRDAVFYNIEGFLADNFPRVKDVLPATQWDTLVRDYLLKHQATTPVFARLPGEFLAYLTHRLRPHDDPPYLYELAHFDWLENLLATDERLLPVAGIDPLGDLLDGKIVVNPIHTLQTYRFPVHAITADYNPPVPPAKETHLVAFRDRAHRYGVLDLNVMSRQLFLAVRDSGGKTARAILTQIADELGQSDPTTVINGGLEILSRMHQRELVLGTRVLA
jgi:uncharacterized protein